MKTTQILLGTFLVLLFCLTSLDSQAQRRKKRSAANSQPATLSFPESAYQALSWRNIGPFRGGRVTTVAGVRQDVNTYYMGSTGGGVWKTVDAGASWKNISDGFFKTGSVGAIAVSAADPNVLYVGMGEAAVRGVMTSHGDGVYKSTDAGQTWTHVGLEKVRQISAVHIHPRNPDLVWVAAQGSPYQPTEDRGIYRSENGGGSWEKVLFVDENSGASALSLDPSNPRNLYAAFWDHQRLPWKVVSGGPGSGIYRSQDGGDSWEKVQKGLPDLMGKIGVAVSPANPQRVYAIVEAKKGGLYRSDDGGASWRLINGDRVLHARSWYYMHVFADPQNPDKVVVLNAPFLQSMDGGRSFRPVRTPHGDNHALWIHPDQPQVMINGNDGGANISFNGGQTWSTQSNQPTAQFYRVNADNRTPYHVYGGQQDNSSVGIPSRAPGGGISDDLMYSVGGCESAYTAFDPDNPEVVYAGCYQGIIEAYNTRTKMGRDIMAYPYLGLGSHPAAVKYRFNWNAPILVSQHDPSVLYHAGNLLLKSTDQGNSWEEISPDLTRNDSLNLGWGGGPITNEGAGGEVYHTLMYIAESPHDAQVIWAGADDGLVHLTRNGGQDWTNVTPPALPKGMVNSIEVSPHDPGTAYLAFTGYKFNNFTPYIYKTTNYGQSWQILIKGIAPEAHVRVVREDPKRKDLLYAGTETGLYLSFDGGNSWQSFQLNLPVVPITDLKVHQGDLIAATQGRAFWVLDDLAALHQLSAEQLQKSVHLFPIRDPYLYDGQRSSRATQLGTNPDNGLVLHYHLKDSLDEAPQLRILDQEGNEVRTLSKLPAVAGMNKYVWNLQTASLPAPKGLMIFTGTGGYRVGPGAYEAQLMVGEDTLTQAFSVLPDPRFKQSQAAYDAQQALLGKLYSTLEDLYKAVNNLEYVHGQLKDLSSRSQALEDSTLLARHEALQKEISQQLEQLVQRKQKTFQDVINFPNQLDANLVYVMRQIQGSPPPLTQGQQQRARDLMNQWAGHQEDLNFLLGEDLEEFNSMMREKAVPYIDQKSEK